MSKPQHEPDDEQAAPPEDVILPVGESDSSDLDVLKKAFEEQKAKNAELYDQFLRLNAEFQNFRKRSELQITAARKAGKEEVLLQIINLADTLAQAESGSQQTKDIDSIKKGLTMLREQFEKFLADQGLVPITAKGEQLDPLKHEAIVRVPSADQEEGTVVDEIQRGYTWNGQIVRPARVSVAAKI
jgi:molecular chaperone GrpE